MAYFNKKQEEPEEEPERLFLHPVQEDFDDDDLPDDYDDEIPVYDTPLTDDEEAALRRRDSLKVAAGVGDFIGVVAGTLVILLLTSVLVSLVNWLDTDLGGFIKTLLGTI